MVLSCNEINAVDYNDLKNFLNATSSEASLGVISIYREMTRGVCVFCIYNFDLNTYGRRYNITTS